MNAMVQTRQSIRSSMADTTITVTCLQDSSLPIPTPIPQASTSKPVLLLDIDGVINFARSLEKPIHHRSWPETSLIRALVGMYFIDYCTTVVDKINLWSRSSLAEIRWLTTWNERAQTMLSPVLKLDFFELARNPRDSALKIKGLVVLRWFNFDPTRKLVWIDDYVPWLLRDVLDMNDPTFEVNMNCMLRSGNVLCIAPETDTGLNHEELGLIESFLKGELSVESVHKQNQIVVEVPDCMSIPKYGAFMQSLYEELITC